MNKIQAHIHSLDGKFAEVTISLNTTVKNAPRFTIFSRVITSMIFTA